MPLADALAPVMTEADVASAAADVVRALRRGDLLVRIAGNWQLQAIGEPLPSGVYSMLVRGARLAARLGGHLVPCGDGLPALGAEHSQTWRWVEDRR